MELWALADLKDKENYYYNIAQKSIENCIKDYDAKELSDEDKSCLKQTSLKLHHIIHDSRLDRWALQPEKRPYEEYWWIKSKI